MFTPRIPTQKEVLLLPLGLLQDLKHIATGGAFIALAQQPDRLPPDEKLDPAQLNKVMPEILKIDAEFRAGKCGVVQFRKKILAILKLKASDDEFDNAWNAMQGDVKKLKEQLDKIKKENKNLDIRLISKTNPIHVKNICGDEKAEPLFVSGIILHPSYQSPQYQETGSDVAFYNEVMTEQKLDAAKTSIILQCTSDSPYPAVKKRDEEAALKTMQWAEFRGIHVIDRKPEENMADAIVRGIKAKLESRVRTESGAKLSSGRVRLWSLEQPAERDAQQAESPVYRR